MKHFLRRCVLCLVCATTGWSAQDQDVESKPSHFSATPKPGTPHRKKKKSVVDDESAAPETKPAEPASAAPEDSATTPKSAHASAATPKPGAHRKKKKSVVDDDSATPEAKPAEPPAAAPEDSTTATKSAHAPAATIETDQLAEFSAQPARVQLLISAALELTKQNLTYTYGSAEPSAGGMDCSGTIYYLFRAQGLKDVPRDSSSQYVWARQHGQFFAVVSTRADSFEFKDLQPGDLMFWSGTYNTGRDVPISHVMLYLGHEKGTGKSVMFGSSDGRSYHGIQRWGVSVFDFKMPKADPANPEKHVDFVGYAHPPGLHDPAFAAAPATPPPRATPAPKLALAPSTTPAPAPALTAAPSATSALPVAPSATPAPAVTLAPTATPAPKLTLADALREPARGDPERKGIMDALRAEKFPGQEARVVFVVKHLRVHHDWAWTDVTPQDHAGKTIAAEKSALLHLEGGKWKSVDLSQLPAPGGKEAGPTFVKSVLALYPDVPPDIFPAAH